MEKINGHVRYMVDNGLLFEINRKILHPLGMALVVGIHQDNSKWLAIEGLVKVPDGDEDGFLFDEETYMIGAEKYAKYLNTGAQEALDKREEAVGFLIQEMKNDK